MIIMQEKIKNAQAPAENSAPKKSKFKTIDVVYIGVFAALIAVCSSNSDSSHNSYHPANYGRLYSLRTFGA